MHKIELENREAILFLVNDYAIKNNIDRLDLMEEICQVIEEEKEHSIHLDMILKDWMVKSGEDVMYYAEEDIYTIVSIELDKIFREEVLEQISSEDLNMINEYLDTNFRKIFEDSYKKKKKINEMDVDDCILSIEKTFNMDEDVADMFVTMFIEKEILKYEI